MHKPKRFLGSILGVALATFLLPGISPSPHTLPFTSVFLAAMVFMIINQLIYSYPNDIRTAPAVMLLILGAIGIVQDALIWLLVSWLEGRIQSGLHVDGILTALLGGLIVRATVFALLALPSRRTQEAA
ncbi:phage holin family protein [Streptomyces sp. NPDC006368]|uniref:phage holin family protein n=1 Tax=Streptomyces sp. NPDC006368 TaxID=3156760 RepID=UPI0033BB950D